MRRACLQAGEPGVGCFLPESGQDLLSPPWKWVAQSGPRRGCRWHRPARRNPPRRYAAPLQERGWLGGASLAPLEEACPAFTWPGWSDTVPSFPPSRGELFYPLSLTRVASKEPGWVSCSGGAIPGWGTAVRSRALTVESRAGDRPAGRPCPSNPRLPPGDSAPTVCLDTPP